MGKASGKLCFAMETWTWIFKLFTAHILINPLCNPVRTGHGKATFILFYLNVNPKLNLLYLQKESFNTGKTNCTVSEVYTFIESTFN